MTRPVRAIIGFVLGASSASLFFLTPNFHSIPTWFQVAWISLMSLVGLWVGMYGFAIDRNKFGIFLILLAAAHTFFLGVLSPINSWSKINTHKWLNGAIFLLVTTLLIRIAIRLARWAENRARRVQ
jgi:hypothetical protein